MYTKMHQLNDTNHKYSYQAFVCIIQYIRYQPTRTKLMKLDKIHVELYSCSTRYVLLNVIHPVKQVFLKEFGLKIFLKIVLNKALVLKTRVSNE